MEGREAVQQTQAEFPHLLVVGDAEHSLINVATVILPHSGPDGGDTATPATLLIDATGTVRWEFRPSSLFRELSANELLAAIDKHLPRSTGATR